jgi:SAM-dependent methyltransferase
MITGREETAREVAGLRRLCEEAGREFRDRHGDDIERYRAVVTRSVQDYTKHLQSDLARLSGGNSVCVDLGQKTASYLDWLQWTFWDLPYFAVALRLPEDRLHQAVRSCGMAYLSLRIFDDVIDRHFSYKGRQGTLFAMFEKDRLTHQRPEGLAILAGLLVCFDGLSHLAGQDDPVSRAMLRESLDALRTTTIGAVMELSPREEWDISYYERLVKLKNVAFWRALYSGIDPERRSPLYGFLERYYALAQKLNDVLDFGEDERRGQPNLLSIHLAAAGGAEAEIARDFLEMGRMAEDLPALERLVALGKLGESLDEAVRLGLFAESRAAQTPAAPAPKEPLGLDWYSTLEDVVGRFGTGVLVETKCMVCGASARKRLFEKQGFTYHRCQDCGHVYVSPRIDGALSARMGIELDTRDFHSELLEVQKFYAGPICHILRSRAPGPRLLDLGFGRGYVLQLAKSYGFEVYGMETSPRQYESLYEQFGDHLHLVKPNDTELPWHGFDAVVISHVLEHLERPQDMLGRLFHAMNPDGVLYVAVPDIESVHFQLFGKKWDAVSPLAHFQYFSEKTLSRLLRECLFTDLERIDHEPVREEIAPRWMRLLRRLGATDAGELAIACRRSAV